MDAVKGCQREIPINSNTSCSTCTGTGEKPGTKATTCGTCKGTGVFTQSQGFFQMQGPCPACDGEGKKKTPCGSCAGSGLMRERRVVTVTIPAGVDTDQQLRLQNEGDAGKMNGPRGHLFVRIRVDPHPSFRREGADIHVDAPVSFTTAALGGTITVPSLSGEAILKVDPGTQPSDKRVMRGKGIKVLNRNTHGNQYVHFQVTIPKRLTTRQRELLEQLDLEMHGPETRSYHTNKPTSTDSSSNAEESEAEAGSESGSTRKGFFGKIKDRFVDKEGKDKDKQ